MSDLSKFGAPTHRELLGYERRLQDLESNVDNMFRVGTVTDVKFDNQLNRWYVRLSDQMSATGQSSSNADQDPNFQSDWIPWKTFGHGTIKFSIPPRNGMRGQLSSPYGRPEMGVVEHYHNYPEANCPSGTPDQFVMQIEPPTDGQSNSSSSSSTPKPLKIVGTKDLVTVTLGDTTVHIDAQSHTITTDTHTVTVKNHTTTAENDIVHQTSGGGKVHVADDGTVYLNS